MLKKPRKCYLLILVIEVAFYVRISTAGKDYVTGTHQQPEENRDLSAATFDGDELSRTPEICQAEPAEASALTTVTDNDVRNSDPFYKTPQAEQVNCTSIGVNSKTCRFIDWLKIYNKTIVESVASKKFNNFDERRCFQRCNVTISCVLYTFNKVNGMCKIYNELKFENIKSDKNWSMFVRITPRFVFLSEWIVTRDNSPRGAPLNTSVASNFFECTVLCAKSAKCVFATLNRGNNFCSIYSKSATQLMELKGNHVSIRHISLSQDDDNWRFRDVGTVYQTKASKTALTVESLESCLQYCYSKDSCQLATTIASDQSTVDCFLYDDFQNTWLKDDPPTKATNSYYKVVSRNNTLYEQLPHFVAVASTSKAMETKRISQLTACHGKAIDSSSCHWYSYNSTSKICRLYDSAVQIRKVASFTKNDLTTFAKSIPTDFLPFYGFDSVWMTKVSLNNIPTSGQSSGQQCWTMCLELANCSGVAIQRPEGNCSLYTQASLTRISNKRNRIPDVGLQTIEMFVKTGDPTFIRSDSQFRSSNKQLVTWDEINQILQFDKLDKIRSDIPRGNNLPLTPHGGSFEGARNGTTNHVSVRNVKVKAIQSDFSSKDTLTIIGLAAVGGALGGPGEALGGTLAGIGVVALDKLVCFFSGCNQKVEKVPCAITCAHGGDDCICTNQPKVDNNPNSDSQDDCKGKQVGEACNICCQVGYKAEEDPVCHCSDDSSTYWMPDPAKCVGDDNCYLGKTKWGNTDMYVLKVSDCKDNLYYGLVFNYQKRLPFYTVYYYTDKNKVADNLKFDRSSRFVALACTDIVDMQLTQADYDRFNRPASPHDKGHLVPHAGVRYNEDSVRSTFVYANAAPQDRYSNRGPWKKLEKQLRDLLGEDVRSGGKRKGFALTGLCLEDGTVPGIPACFWKMACTQTDDNVVTVAWFYHQNIASTTLLQKNDRKDEVEEIRDQSTLSNLLGVDSKKLWEEAVGFFVEDADKKFIKRCKNAERINFPLTSDRNTRAARDYALYNFWKKKVLGKGFDANTTETEDEAIGQSESGAPPSCGTKVVGYVTGWSDVKFTLSAASYLTHAIFAFIQMKSDGTLVVGSADPENSNNVSVDTKKSYLRLYELKAAKEKSSNRLKTIFAVGGWANSQFYSAVAGSATQTQNFVRTALEIVDYFNMDGIDIAWEYPVTGGANEGTKQDRKNYVSFLKSLKNALASHQRSKGRNEPYSLTIAGAAGSWVLDDGFDLPAIAETVDWINVMTYDYNGAWESKWGAYTGPHAPLYYGAPPGYSGKTNVDYTMKYYSCRIQNPNKLVMGLGFYGRFWNISGKAVGKNPVWRIANKNAAGKFDGGFEPWRSIARNYLKNPSFKKSFDEKTQTPYLENSSGFLLGYEDTRSMHAKVKYAAAKKFAGVMIWAVDLDDAQNSLLRTVSSESLCASDAQISSQYKCPPIQDQRWWTLLDDTNKAGMCGKTAPLYKGYYPVCDPEDPGYACCSASGFCGTGDKFCKCDGCVDYYENPEKILNEPVKPTSPVRWHTMDKFEKGPQCGYLGHKLKNGDFAICNPDDANGFCCSAAGYCGKKSESCDCEGCVNFKKNPNFKYPAKTWIDSGSDAGKCGKSANVNGKPATCNPLSKDYYCCSDVSTIKMANFAS